MKKYITFSFTVFIFSVISTFSQSTLMQPIPTPSRVIVTNNIPKTQPVRTPTPLPRPAQTPVIVVGSMGGSATAGQSSNLNYKGLSFAQIKSKLAEARRYLTARPLTIASSEPTGMPIVQTSVIRVAFYDNKTRQIDSYVLSKDQFLAHGLATVVTTASGKQFISQTIRGNGVNTPLVITDQNGNKQIPLMVQYPRENRGVMSEMAYYVSSHPELTTPEVVNAGRFYVRNTVDVAREQLKVKGYFIQPKVADIGERLATIEHVDSLRFRTEFHPNIYNDIFTLYALNEGQTYRYSVSSAGAGGMIQMIAPTYRMVRARYPNAALIPDFVEGMQNHANAAQAMLLYLQMTWNDLAASPTVSNAMATGIATQEQLMAAGYNSNPSKLAGYIKRGGASWNFLIPRETQLYLQVWTSLERAVPMTPRKQ